MAGDQGDGKVEQQASPRVLIVGAGPAGLSLAIELGQRGIACLVIERNDRVGYAPRAKTTNVRTREHLRRWGIADRLRAASPLGVDYPSNVVFCTRLAGVELARHENAMYCAPDAIRCIRSMRNGFRNTRSRACCAITRSRCRASRSATAANCWT